MIDGPVTLSLSDEVGEVMVYRKVFDNGHDSYLTVGSEYAREHPDEVAPEKLEELLDGAHANPKAKWNPEVKQMFRELFEFMVDELEEE